MRTELNKKLLMPNQLQKHLSLSVVLVPRRFKAFDVPQLPLFRTKYFFSVLYVYPS